MEIKTENELAALILGVSLGHDLSMLLESIIDGDVCFSDFEVAGVTVNRSGHIEAVTDNIRDHLAIMGAISEAQREASKTWQAWEKGGAKNA